MEKVEFNKNILCMVESHLNKLPDDHKYGFSISLPAIDHDSKEDLEFIIKILR